MRWKSLPARFDDSFRQQLYPLVADLQDRLGKINDHVTALTYLTAWHNETDAAAVREAIEAGMQVEQKSLDDSQREFLEWWSAEKREQLRTQFARYVPQDSPPTQAIEASAFARDRIVPVRRDASPDFTVFLHCVTSRCV